MPYQIFLSYLTADSQQATGRLFTSLNSMFGNGVTFMDTYGIDTGEHFERVIFPVLANVKVVLVIIGRNWSQLTDADGRLKIESWVQRELNVALEKQKTCIPIFVDGAKVPSISFPEESVFHDLLGKKGLELRSYSWEQDLEQLKKILCREIDILGGLPLPKIELNKYPISPFIGLNYFSEKEMWIFFGRNQDIREIYEQLCGNLGSQFDEQGLHICHSPTQILLLYGQSGVGKSSILSAGLIPRLTHRGWSVIYIRREKVKGIHRQLEEIIDQSRLSQTSPTFIILDQLEEIFTVPNPKVPDEGSQLVDMIINNLESPFNIKYILGFRKEFLSDIEKLLNKNKMLHIQKKYLLPLDRLGIVEAITGITKDFNLKDFYRLRVEEGLADEIASDMLKDKDSHIAPLLQLILAEMWKYTIQNDGEPCFDRELYRHVRTSSFEEMVSTQINKLTDRFYEEVTSGLILDILHFFTTPELTSAEHNWESVLNRYNTPNIRDVLLALKNLFLLTEPRDRKSNTLRLTHDSLAVIIEKMFTESELPGQKALRLIDSKGITNTNYMEVEFSNTDLEIIGQGQSGMRQLSSAEVLAIQKSRERIEQGRLNLEQMHRQALQAVTSGLISASSTALANKEYVGAFLKSRKYNLAQKSRLMHSN